jgi:uncharacterized membrane protein
MAIDTNDLKNAGKLMAVGGVIAFAGAFIYSAVQTISFASLGFNLHAALLLGVQWLLYGAIAGLAIGLGNAICKTVTGKSLFDRLSIKSSAKEVENEHSIPVLSSGVSHVNDMAKSEDATKGRINNISSGLQGNNAEYIQKKTKINGDVIEKIESNKITPKHH